MCTAVTFHSKDFYFGRTLDYEFSYGEQIVITPRNFPLVFHGKSKPGIHYAIIGMAHVSNNYPLYYDAVNEKGLAMAGLNFVGNAKYHPHTEGKDNIAGFQFIPWILSQCASVTEAKTLLAKINLTDKPFSDQLPPAQLHWLIADRSEAITVESVADGLRIYPNPAGVLTNNPSFDQQMLNLSNYMQLSADPPENRFSKTLALSPYSRGMGAMGLPGDLSSQSRFVRAAFTRCNSVCDGSEYGSVNQFFHIMDTVSQARGCCRLEDGKYEISIYTSCCNADKGIYYYTTYDNRHIHAVSMHAENLDSHHMICHQLILKEDIQLQNLPKNG